MICLTLPAGGGIIRRYRFMNTERIFNVAGLRFRLRLPASERLWAALEEQYSPFEVPPVTGEKLLFTLSCTEDRPSMDGAECIYDVPTEPGETVVKLYRSADRLFFEAAPDSHCPFTFLVRSSADFSEAEIFLNNRLVRDAVFSINNAAMLLFAFAGAAEGVLELHSSVIENRGRAYMFLGRSGTGKSTHSSLWLKHIPGSTLMNDDNPALRVHPDGRVMVYGSPWSGKTKCYKNLEYPAGAFVQIRQSPENKIARLKTLEAYSCLYGSVSGLKNEDARMFDFISDSMDKVISSVPFYVLDCRPDAEAAYLCHETVASRL